MPLVVIEELERLVDTSPFGRLKSRQRLDELRIEAERAIARDGSAPTRTLACPEPLPHPLLELPRAGREGAARGNVRKRPPDACDVLSRIEPRVFDRDGYERTQSDLPFVHIDLELTPLAQVEPAARLDRQRDPALLVYCHERSPHRDEASQVVSLLPRDERKAPRVR